MTTPNGLYSSGWQGLPTGANGDYLVRIVVLNAGTAAEQIGSANCTYSSSRAGSSLKISPPAFGREIMIIVLSHQLPRLLGADHSPLSNYESLGRDALLSIPTADHYLPLLSVLGTRIGESASASRLRRRWRLDFHARRSNRLKKTRLTESRFSTLRIVAVILQREYAVRTPMRSLASLV